MPYHLPVVFGIELTRQAGGIGEITEQYGELATFRRWKWSRRAGSGRRLLPGGLRRTTRPNQHCPFFVHCEPLALNEFGLQVLKVVVLQVGLALCARYVSPPRRWSMAIAWSRISSKVITHPPYADAASGRQYGNWTGRSGTCIPHVVDERT
jgi:hypothetical protein